MAGGSRLSNKTITVAVVLSMAFVTVLVFYIGTNKIKLGIAREIHNASSKEPIEVYSLLFQGAVDTCVKVLNFKDQVLPMIDCCIWMEVKICSAELNRIIASKKYTSSKLNRSDSMLFLKAFDDRPKWWSPQTLGDTLTRYTIWFKEGKEQTLFVGGNNDRIYLCDLAL